MVLSKLAEAGTTLWPAKNGHRACQPAGPVSHDLHLVTCSLGQSPPLPSLLVILFSQATPCPMHAAHTRPIVGSRNQVHLHHGPVTLLWHAGPCMLWMTCLCPRPDVWWR